MCCTRRYRQPTDDGRKKVSGPGKFSQESADCPPGSRHESWQPARQLVEATLAALRDPFLELAAVGSSPFCPNGHNRKSARRLLLPSQHGSKRVSLCGSLFSREWLTGTQVNVLPLRRPLVFRGLELGRRRFRFRSQAQRPLRDFFSPRATPEWVTPDFCQIFQ